MADVHPSHRFREPDEGKTRWCMQCNAPTDLPNIRLECECEPSDRALLRELALQRLVSVELTRTVARCADALERVAEALDRTL